MISYKESQKLAIAVSFPGHFWQLSKEDGIFGCVTYDVFVIVSDIDQLISDLLLLAI